MSQTAAETAPAATFSGSQDVNYSVVELRTMEAIGKQVPDIPQWETFRVNSKIVDQVPAKPPKVDLPPTLWDRVKAVFKGPAVRANERLRDFEGKYYTKDGQGRIIETTVERTVGGKLDT